MTQIEPKNQQAEFDLLSVFGIVAKFFLRYKWWVLTTFLFVGFLAYFLASRRANYEYELAATVDRAVLSSSELELMVMAIPDNPYKSTDTLASLIAKASVKLEREGRKPTDPVGNTLRVKLRLDKKVSPQILTDYLLERISAQSYYTQLRDLNEKRLLALLQSTDSLRTVMLRSLEGAVLQRKSSTVYVEASTADAHFFPLHSINSERENLVMSLSLLEPLYVLTPFGEPDKDFARAFLIYWMVLFVLGVFALVGIEVFRISLRHVEQRDLSARQFEE